MVDDSFLSKERADDDDDEELCSFLSARERGEEGQVSISSSSSLVPPLPTSSLPLHAPPRAGPVAQSVSFSSPLRAPRLDMQRHSLVYIHAYST